MWTWFLSFLPWYPLGRPTGRMLWSICSRTFVSPLGRGKWGERQIEREPWSKFKVVLCLGAENASHSSRNSIWIRLKISVWFPIPFRSEGKTQASDHQTITASHCITTTLMLVKSVQDSTTLHILPAPFTNTFLWTTQWFLSISGCSHFFNFVEQEGVLAVFPTAPCFFYRHSLIFFLRNSGYHLDRFFPSCLLSLTVLWGLLLCSVTLAPELVSCLLTSVSWCTGNSVSHW